MTSFILASTSPTRAALLEGAGLSFTVQAPLVDEDAATAGLLADGAGPAAIAEALAEMKALKVSRRGPGLVLGADQTLDLDGVLIGKAHTRETAAATLRRLRGRRHQLHAAAVVARDGVPIWRAVRTASLVMREFTDDFLEAYVDAEGPALFGSVGAYRIEGRGAQLFAAVEGDHFTILGLPLIEVLDLLRRHGAASL